MPQYVKNKDLLEEVIRCQDGSLGPSIELIKMWQLMAERFSHKMSYNNPDDRYDCMAQGVMDCYLYWNNFDPTKSTNAFAYYTQLIKNGFAKGWKKIHPPMMKHSISTSHNDLYSL